MKGIGSDRGFVSHLGPGMVIGPIGGVIGKGVGPIGVDAGRGFPKGLSGPFTNGFDG